ncbi:hypothetical protein Rsub_05000 [Raphidocelis subcapitata]|uniref:Ribokinase n=1 Tax=Raphidocelis subcapitata TaxID=307507 RepID=A0A2V0P483_9CHLO|nr:hypothetical protein Rsub_05000 [Raphidocelis subcapitata]|eukprot:GBF91895.1 hypothetical protein Rsub_05000 [Raphidocelis subcapitata]
MAARGAAQPRAGPTSPRAAPRRPAAPAPSAAPAAAAAPAAGPAPGPKPLVVVGSVNADLVLAVDRVPAPGETLAAASLQTFPGGKGANQAAAAARLGYETFFIGATGTDANAPLLRAELEGCGVRLDHLAATEGPSGTAVILLQPSGENSIIIVGGANQDSRSWALPPAAEALLRTAGAVLLQREVPESVNTAVAEAARGAGVPVFLDAGGVDAPLGPRLLAAVTLLSPNETELERLTGLPTDSPGAVEAAARALIGSGVPQVLVKLGSEGSMLLTGPDAAPLRQPCVPAPRVVDTTGAGDCFTAAYAVATLEGQPPRRALLFASAAASLCVRRVGAMPSMPSRGEVDALLAEVQ